MQNLPGNCEVVEHNSTELSVSCALVCCIQMLTGQDTHELSLETLRHVCLFFLVKIETCGSALISVCIGTVAHVSFVCNNRYFETRCNLT